MIRFRFDGSERHPEPIAFVGLSDENVRRLRAGQPIRLAAGDPLELGVELVIYHGADEVATTRELEDHGFMPPGAAEKTRQAMERRGEWRHDR